MNVASYMIKALGYSLLGDNPERVIFFLAGETSSGKSTLLEIIGQVLGPLAHNSQPDLITWQRQGRNARTENSIRGKRLVAITETGGHMQIDEAQVKRLTGERWVSMHQHYAKTEIETRRTWTIWVATNEMPSLTNFDAAMRQRVIVIPAGAALPPHMRDKAKAARIIEREAAGILRLLVAGCIQYHAEERERLGKGLLMPPLEIQVATDKYAADQDTVANFLRDCCEPGAPGAPPVQWSVPFTEAWSAYRAWAQGSGRLGKHEFFAALSREPGVFRNDTMRRFEGVRLAGDWASRIQDLS